LSCLCSTYNPVLQSFPTRRSSDLGFASTGSSPMMAYADATGGPSTKAAKMFAKAMPAEPGWAVWGSAFGGGGHIGGDTAAGSQDVSSRIYGLATGADYRLAPDMTVGFALSGGQTSFNVAQGGGYEIGRANV